MASFMQFAYTNKGTAGTYLFEINPIFAQTEKQFTDRARSVDASLIEFFKGAKNTFVLDFPFIGTNQFANFGTIWRTHANLTFWPFDETRGTTGTYEVRWVNDFDFKPIGPSWDNGYTGKILLEEI